MDENFSALISNFTLDNNNNEYVCGGTKYIVFDTRRL